MATLYGKMSGRKDRNCDGLEVVEVVDWGLFQAVSNNSCPQIADLLLHFLRLMGSNWDVTVDTLGFLGHLKAVPLLLYIHTRV
jgi:hypothetical protein